MSANGQWRISDYSITSSARAISKGDMVIPNAWAVFKLTNSSNRVGSSNGSSRGEAPLRSRSYVSGNPAPKLAMIGEIRHQATCLDVAFLQEHRRQTSFGRQPASFGAKRKALTGKTNHSLRIPFDGKLQVTLQVLRGPHRKGSILNAERGRGPLNVSHLQGNNRHSGCVRRAKRRADGITSLRSAIRFEVISAAMLATPVTLASGRAMLATKPKKTGSATIAETIGILAVPAMAALVPGVFTATMTSGALATRSAASFGIRSSWFSPDTTARFKLTSSR